MASRVLSLCKPYRALHPLAHCRAFATMEDGMRYCEGQFLEVAQRHGLCRPSSSVLTLTDILELHASVVSASTM